MYSFLCFLHSAAYMTLLVLQEPPRSILIFLSFLLFKILKTKDITCSYHGYMIDCVQSSLLEQKWYLCPICTTFCQPYFCLDIFCSNKSGTRVKQVIYHLLKINCYVNYTTQPYSVWAIIKTKVQEGGINFLTFCIVMIEFDVAQILQK